MMDERRRVWIMIGISAVVRLTAALLVIVLEGFNAWSLLSLLIIVTIVLLALFFVMRALKDLRSGFPLEDERSRYLNLRAGYRAFYTSMYAVLALAFVTLALEDHDIVLSTPEVLFVVVALMGSIHLAFSGYYNRKGKVSIE
jgi:hypothetical protein